MTKHQIKQAPPGIRFFFSRIFPLIFVIVGAAVIYKGIVSICQAKQSTSWPTAQGVIRSSSVERRHSTGGGSNRRSSTTYHAAITYDFTVSEKSVSGKRVGFGDYGSSNRSHAEKIAQMYPQEKAVTVYYNPQDPQQCVLEPGIKFQTLFMPVFGLVFFGAGAFMAVSLPKAMKKQAEAANDSQQPEIIEIREPQSDSNKTFYPESSIGTLSSQNRYPGQS